MRGNLSPKRMVELESLIGKNENTEKYLELSNLTLEEELYLIMAKRMPYDEILEKINEYDKNKFRIDEIKFLEEINQKYNVNSYDLIIKRIQNIRSIKAFIKEEKKKKKEINKDLINYIFENISIKNNCYKFEIFDYDTLKNGEKVWINDGGLIGVTEETNDIYSSIKIRCIGHIMENKTEEDEKANIPLALFEIFYLGTKGKLFTDGYNNNIYCLYSEKIDGNIHYYDAIKITPELAKFWDYKHDDKENIKVRRKTK